jgi:tetratricopeptide (TPR) repeat protein
VHIKDLGESASARRGFLILFYSAVGPRWKPVTRSTASVCLICLLRGPAFFQGQGPAATWEEHLRFGKELRKQGHYQQAEQEYRAALQEAERFGENDPRRAKVLETLGELRILRGDYLDAERCLRLALSIEEQAYGKEHPDVGITLNNLARSLRHQGKLEEGARLVQQACAILQQRLGANHLPEGVEHQRKNLRQGASKYGFNPEQSGLLPTGP